MTPCVLFRGHIGRGGYGKTWFGGNNHNASRVAYCKHHGLSLKDIRGLVVRHKCDNPPCVNVEHLEIGDYKDNMLDKMQRGRWRGNGKLTPGEREQIKALYVRGSRQFGTVALGRRFGVTAAAIQMLVTDKTWKTVK